MEAMRIVKIFIFFLLKIISGDANELIDLLSEIY